MSASLLRDQRTWLAYLLLAFYGFMLNILGPLTPFLKSDLQLTYTISSLHFTAFALGILLAGLFGHLVILPLGRWRSLWAGAVGLSLGAGALIVGRSPVVTVSATFMMGLVGSLILAVVPSALSEQHGEQRAVALSEANVVASLASAFAPLVVGWSVTWMGNWRLGLGLAAALPLAMYLAFRSAAPAARPWGSVPERGSTLPRSRLPGRYWVFWTLLLLAVAVEFCMIFWSADYLETALGFPKAAAAQWVSLFLAGMILGRIAGSRLVERYPARRLVIALTLTAGLGFGLYWTAPQPWLGLVGLFVTGLGVSNLYPLLLALAIGSAGPAMDQASARAALASGAAIFTLPLVLGRLADLLDIQRAYGVVAFLLAALFVIVIAATLRPDGRGRGRPLSTAKS